MNLAWIEVTAIKECLNHDRDRDILVRRHEAREGQWGKVPEMPSVPKLG